MTEIIQATESGLGHRETRPTRVTLFEDRAEVVREAQVALPEGRSWVSLSGVTPFVDDRSLQAKLLTPGARILTARVRRSLVYDDSVGREALRAQEEELRQKVRHQELEARALEREQLLLTRLGESLEQWASELKGHFEASQEATWSESYQGLCTEASATIERINALEASLIKAQEEVALAQSKLAESARREPRYEAFLEVEVESASAQQATLEVTYRTPCALWRPEHMARLYMEPNETRRGEVEIVTFATAWQLTGERWEGVPLSFSTARPARQASPPLIQEDLLVLRKKTEEERRNIYVEVREQAIASTGAERGARVLDEMPGVDDGGAPLHFTPVGKATLVSDGRPFRVEVARVRLPCAVTRVAFPERMSAAHIKANATLSDSLPLLAGPARLARGPGIVGRSRLSYVAPGEPFELGFGVDDGVRIRRTQSEQRDIVPVLGTQKVKQTVEVFLSNLSGETREVEVTERVPVSEIEEVEISLLEEGGFRVDKDGFARQVLRLPANETKQLRLSYEVRAPSKVRLG